MATRAAVPRMLGFGSSQDRGLVPSARAVSARAATELRLGPGSYENHAVGTILHNLQSRPESKRGYILSRTASRFPSISQAYTPSAHEEQQDRSLSITCSPARAPFNSSNQRFRSNTTTLFITPGPGTYAHDTPRNQKVSWPMKFGSPDWTQVPQPERKAARKELLCDKEFIKQRNRVAYLRLFYT